MKNLKLVTEILSSKYTIEAQPGKKTKCYECEKDNFHIHRTDLWGKCYTPGCAFRLRALSGGDLIQDEVQDILEDFLTDCNRNLLSQAGFGKQSAYSYTVDIRKTHPEILSQALIGAVPKRHDALDRLKKLVEKISADIKHKTEHPESDPKKKSFAKELEDLTEKIGVANKWLDTLTVALTKITAGWVAFFHTDENMRITKIRFRKPDANDKRFMLASGGSESGVFGLNLPSWEPAKDPRFIVEHIEVCEGEFNVLRAQSLMLYAAEECGASLAEYLPLVSLGSANDDPSVLSKLCRIPTICNDNDADGAGFQLIKRAQEKSAVRSYTTPGVDSDLDSFIDTLRGNHQAALQALTQIRNQTTIHYRNIESVAKEVYAIRKRKEKQFEIDARVADLLRDELGVRGKFHFSTDTGYTYYFSHETKELIYISQEDTQFKRLLSMFGINASEQLFKYELSDLSLHAQKEGERTKTYQFHHYGAASNRVYIYNGGHVIRVSPLALERVDNGTDGVLFCAPPAFTPFKLKLNGSPATTYFKDLIVNGANFLDEVDGLGIQDKRNLFELWIYSIFFDELFPTRMLLGFFGPKGSGKSLTLRKLVKLLIGPDADVTSFVKDQKDFDTKLINSRFCVLDNVDEFVSWLMDRLASVATSSSIPVRELYTTSKLVEHKLNCYLAITSRTPFFRRDDVAERFLPLWLKRIGEDDASNKIEGAAFKAESTMLKEFLEHRDEVMEELVYKLQAILGEVEKNISRTWDTRIADFPNFSSPAARATLGLDDERLEKLLKKLELAQCTFSVSENPLYDLLNALLRSGSITEKTTSEICKELSNIALRDNLDFPYDGKPIVLGRKMKNMVPELRKFFEISFADKENGTNWTIEKRESKKKSRNSGGKAA